MRSGSHRPWLVENKGLGLLISVCARQNGQAQQQYLCVWFWEKKTKNQNSCLIK